MVQLFIANATAQRHAFMYYVPDDDGGRPSRGVLPRTQYIAAGGQEKISGDLSTAQLQAIVDQHQPYGLIDVNEIDRTKEFRGLCYSWDKPVSSARLAQLMTHNIDVLDERGRKMRELAAVSVSNNMETHMQENRMPGELKKVEMEITEVRTDRSDSDETAPQRVRVARENPEGRRGPGRPRKAA